MWSFEHNQPAGRGTDTLPAASVRCIAEKRQMDRRVLGVRPKEATLSYPEQRQTLNAFANQAALAIERASLAEQARQADCCRLQKNCRPPAQFDIARPAHTPVSITGRSPVWMSI